MNSQREPLDPCKPAFFLSSELQSPKRWSARPVRLTDWMAPCLAVVQDGVAGEGNKVRGKSGASQGRRGQADKKGATVQEGRALLFSASKAAGGTLQDVEVLPPLRPHGPGRPPNPAPLRHSPLRWRQLQKPPSLGFWEIPSRGGRNLGVVSNITIDLSGIERGEIKEKCNTLKTLG